MSTISKIPIIGQIIDKLFPDKNEALAAKTRILEMEEKGELEVINRQFDLLLGQQAINLQDAKSSSKFQSGWRPAAGWAGVFGLVYTPFTAILAWAIQLLVWLNAETVVLADFPMPPKISTAELVMILSALLGIGGYRTVERHLRHTKWKE